MSTLLHLKAHLVRLYQFPPPQPMKLLLSTARSSKTHFCFWKKPTTVCSIQLLSITKLSFPSRAGSYFTHLLRFPRGMKISTLTTGLCRSYCRIIHHSQIGLFGAAGTPADLRCLWFHAAGNSCSALQRHTNHVHKSTPQRVPIGEFRSDLLRIWSDPVSGRV